MSHVEHAKKNVKNIQHLISKKRNWLILEKSARSSIDIFPIVVGKIVVEKY